VQYKNDRFDARQLPQPDAVRAEGAQQPAPSRLQAYVVLNQTEANTVARFRRSFDGTVPSDSESGAHASDRSASRGSSASDQGDGRFISSLMCAQQAQMRVYV
jgi:hypothetical protein